MFAPQSPKGNVSNIVGTTNSDQSTTTKITDNLIDLDQTISNIGEILTDPLGGVSKILGQINDQIGPKGILNALGNLDTEATKLVKTFGISKERAGELTQTVADAIPKFVDMGLDVGDVAETMKTLGESMNTNMMISSDVLADFAATAEVTGVKQGELATKFRDVGFSIASVGDQMMDVVKVAQQAGTTVAAVSEGVVGNLDKMNLYNFEGGVKGLAKMAAQASRLGVNMQSIFSVVDKVFNPEGAIEFAASLQRLGVTSSQLLDPLRLMDLAQNDPTELQNQIVNMTKEFTRFNKENNQIEILPGAKRRIDEIGKAMGLPAGELQKMAVNAGMFEMKLKQIKFPTDIANKEDRELIATMAQINKEGKAVVRIEQKDKDGKGTGEYIEKMVSELSTDDVKNLAEQQKSDAKSMEEISKDQLTELKRIASSINAFVGAAKYGIASSNTAQEGYIGGLRMFQNLLDEKLPSEGKKTQNWRTGTDATVGVIGDFINSSGVGTLMTTLKDKSVEYFDYLKSQVSSAFGMGGVDTDGPNQNLIQTLNNPNVNISYDPMTITTENKFTVDFNVSADEKISPQAQQDINRAISDYFSGPDSTKNMEKLLMRIDDIRVSSGQKPIFRK
jgi:hypothetical protein